MLKLIKTNISKAYWCVTNKFEPAENIQPSNDQTKEFFEFMEGHENSMGEISWFDNLFDGGGIAIPEDQGKPIIMLLSGPPGSGKTTLALELCLRVAICHGFWSLYISTESETEQLIKKASDLGIKNSQKRILAFNRDIKREIKKLKEIENIEKGKKLPILTIYGQENIQQGETFSEIVQAAIDDVVTWLIGSKSEVLKKILEHINQEGVLRTIAPDILVFDNLNVVKQEERYKFFEKIVKNRNSKTKLIVVILDSHASTESHEAWEFACDNIVRLDYSIVTLDQTSLRDYYLRHIEVIKARYQAHVWGKQQLKIYKPFDLDKQTDSRADSNHPAKMQRAHPYREEGGIFIYPSIHYYLSEYKRSGSTIKVTPVPTPCMGLNEEIEGFPEARCTAFMGCRGAHKSHLGYLHLLERVEAAQEAGIVISLRDDEEMTKQHLLRILSERFVKDKKANPNEKAEEELNRFLKDMNLEILYYPPGYITPDEFFHRMFMSIYRLRKQGKKITLLFNSLDQLAARFPLCAHQSIFIPAMIESLSGEKVTSIFIAVDEPGQPPTQYGLLPMADLILTFDRYKIREDDYYVLHNKKYDKVSEQERRVDATMLQISRHAGGQKAGTRGLLELIYSNKSSNSLIKEPGLHFKVWNYDYFEA